MHRLSANITEEDHARLLRLAARHHAGNATNTIRTALHLYEILKTAETSGGKILIRTPDGGEAQLILITS